MRHKTPRQLARVRSYCRPGRWYTLTQISAVLCIPEQSASARLRDLRKKVYGGFRVLRRLYSEKPLRFEYRIVRQYKKAKKRRAR